MANHGHSRLLFLYCLAKGDEGSEHTITENTKNRRLLPPYVVLTPFLPMPTQVLLPSKTDFDERCQRH